jgi:tryptophan synthase beta chain
MSLKIRKGVPLIDQHDKNFMYGGKFGGNFIPETLKKPIDDLTKLFSKLRVDKKFLRERDYYFKNYVGAPTPFIKLENLTEHLLKFTQKWCLKPMEALTKFTMLLFIV